METTARYKCILEVAEKYRKGDFVSWDKFIHEMNNNLITGKHYKIDLQLATKRINKYGRYCWKICEIAHRLGVSRATVYRWEKQGIIRLQTKYEPENNLYYVYDVLEILDQLRQK